MGGGAHPGARASRPHALPFGAAQFPCDAAAGYLAGGNAMGSAEAESQRRFRSSRVEEMGEAVPGPVRAGRPRSRVASSRDVFAAKRPIGLCVFSWFAFNNHRQFLTPMIGPAGAALT